MAASYEMAFVAESALRPETIAPYAAGSLPGVSHRAKLTEGFKLRRINEVANWGREWQKGGDWSSHSSSREQARSLVPAYLRFVRMMCGDKPVRPQASGLDIGAGAGCIAAALASIGGLQMTASEWNEDGIKLINRENPGLPTRMVDLMSFDDRDQWDFILCRELYPFTRTNAFSDQADMVSRAIDALTPGGVFMLIGSTVSFPHCADYDLLIRTFRKDARVQGVSGPFLEAVLLRFKLYAILGRPGYKLANGLAKMVIPLIKGRRWAAVGVIVFQKRND